MVMSRIKMSLFIAIELCLLIMIFMSSEWLTGQILFLSQMVVGLSLVAFQVKKRSDSHTQDSKNIWRFATYPLLSLIIIPTVILITQWNPRSGWLAVSHSLLTDQQDIVILIGFFISGIALLFGVALSRGQNAR